MPKSHRPYPPGVPAADDRVGPARTLADVELTAHIDA
jgi:hypothetical protein